MAIDQKEVDFILDERIAIEVKTTKKISKDDLEGIEALKEENLSMQYYMVSHDPIDAFKDEISCLHWKTFMKRLWAGGVV